MSGELKTNHKINDFTDLIAWQKSHELVVMIYKMTKEFPEKEKFGLISQLERAAVSVTSNIAEGFGRSHSKEKDQFLSVASGSLSEVENQLMIARDVGYIDIGTFNKLYDQAVESHKVLNGLRRANRKKGDDSSSKI